jgi:hypothetical protein
MSEVEPHVPSIDSLIAEALQESQVADPREVVDQVVAGISGDMRAFYLRQMILGRLSTVVGDLRAANMPRPVRRGGVSTKQSLIRDQYWPAFLRQRIALPEGYKFLADATAADLRVVAAQREAQARDLQVKAAQFSSLADLMDKARVKRLEQLDPRAGRQVMERAA